MAESIKEKVTEAGHKMSEAATRIGNKVGEKVEAATDWAKEKAHEAGHRIEETTQKVQNRTKEVIGDSCGAARSKSDIAEHMDVVGSCGKKLGKVDHVVGSSIKLTKHDSPDGVHHLIPTEWVERVDEHVHLNRDCGQAKREWQTV